MTESTGKTIRFPPDLLMAIQKCADARGMSFSEVVIEACESKYKMHSIPYRVEILEKKVADVEARLSN